MAATPSPALIGVQKIAVSCEISPGFSTAEKAGICDQIIARAKSATNRPVNRATAADLEPLSGKLHKQQLVLRVKVDARDVAPGRKALAIEVLPVRLMHSAGQLTAQRSSASLVRVQNNWVLQGPVDAFQKIIGTTGKRRVRAPITSDRD